MRANVDWQVIALCSVAGALMVLLLVAIVSFSKVEAPAALVVPAAVEECHTATILVPMDDWVMNIGEQVICAKAWRWSNVYGPDLATFIESQRDTEAALLTELARWKDCARDVQYCTEAMKGEMRP